jgi:hypothetical protein
LCSAIETQFFNPAGSIYSPQHCFENYMIYNLTSNYETTFYTHAYSHSYIHTYTYIHTYIRTYIHTHTYIYTYIHAHTHTHTQNWHNEIFIYVKRFCDLENSPSSNCTNASQSRPEYLLFAQLLNKIPAFCVIRRFSSVLTNVSHWSLSSAVSIHPISHDRSLSSAQYCVLIYVDVF